MPSGSDGANIASRQYSTNNNIDMRPKLIINFGFPDIFNSQIEWIVNNKTLKNIVYVAQVGDLTESFNEIHAEWDIARTAMYKLEPTAGNIPYGIAVGGHYQTMAGIVMHRGITMIITLVQIISRITLGTVN